MANFFQSILNSGLLGVSWNSRSTKSEGEWAILPPMRSKRHGCSAAIVEERMLVIMGGHDGASEMDNVEILTLENGVWNPKSVTVSSMISRRLGCVAATLTSDEECIVVFGGHNGGVLDSVERYNPRLDVWTELSSLPMGGRFEAAAVSLRHQLFVIGGHDGRKPSNEMNIFNANFCTWSNCPPMKVKRFQCAAAMLLDRYIYVVGGDDLSRALNSVEMYDTEIKVWTALPPMISRRKGCVAAGIGNCVYVFGGSDGTHVLNSCEKYDIITQSWSLLPPMKFKRFRSAIAVSENRICVVGGFDGNTLLQTIEEFTVSANASCEMTKRQADRSTEKVRSMGLDASVEYPHELMCPITGELMTDPVVASDGQSYERQAIEEWFSRFPFAENPRSPTTNKPMEKTLFPNQNLKSLCRQYTEKTLHHLHS